MAHGTPDWQVTGPKSINYALYDLGELAARLGSPVVYDRRGDVIFLDDFGNGEAEWTYVTSGAGAVHYPTAYYARGNGVAQLLGSGVTESCYARMSKYIYLPELSCLGLAGSLLLEVNLVKVYLGLYVASGSRELSYRMTYRHLTGDLCVASGAVAENVVTTISPLYNLIPLFHYLKLRVDPVNEIYTELLINGIAVDLSAWTPQITTIGFPKSIRVDFYVEGSSGLASAIVVDHVILTQNE